VRQEHSVRPGPRGWPGQRALPERPGSPGCSERPELQARSRALRALRAQSAGPAPQRVQPAGPVQQAGTVPQGHRAQPLRAA
jgi:hypothetical protein